MYGKPYLLLELTRRCDMNLWKEILSALKDKKKTWEDVRWVGTYKFKISKDNFEMLAKKTDYDNGYGGQEVASDLLIVGDGWYLERAEYDGSEWWRFVSAIKEPTRTRKVKTLVASCGWETLAEANKEYRYD